MPRPLGKARGATLLARWEARDVDGVVFAPYASFTTVASEGSSAINADLERRLSACDAAVDDDLETFAAMHDSRAPGGAFDEPRACAAAGRLGRDRPDARWCDEPTPPARSASYPYVEVRSSPPRQAPPRRDGRN
jgi:hypothetical protein